MRALAAIVLVIPLISCATPSLVECGDGRVCPAGSVCTPSGCSLPGLCGDGAIDDGELCDDGNRTSGDGCSSTCIAEGCPTGVLDLGEECDDGNALSHDGCSSGCLVERPIWKQLMQGSPPGPLGGMAAAWIPDRGRAILHGGSTTGFVTRGEAWWWDGITWTPAPSGPPPLQQHAMASDGGSAVVLFGGNTGSGGPTTACWVWDAAWTPCVGPFPPARNDAAMAVGTNLGEVVLYGGTEMFTVQSTWRRNASGWSDLDRTGPPNAAYPAMAYDPSAREHVLFFPIGAPRQTWTLGAAGWTSHVDSATPRDSATIVYDADRGTMVAFGGIDELIGSHNETFERDATGWSEVAVGLRPSPRSEHVSFHDSVRRGVVMFGGYYVGDNRGDTWILRWESATLDENCTVTTDADGDGLAGCADPDCWGRCDPRCAPRVSDCDPARPRCGDGTCNLDLETTALCPADCP